MGEDLALARLDQAPDLEHSRAFVRQPHDLHRRSRLRVLERLADLQHLVSSREWGEQSLEPTGNGAEWTSPELGHSGGSV